MDVYIDGTLQATVDLYHASQIRKQSLYKSPALTRGTHTIKLQVSGTKNAASTGYAIGFDTLKVKAKRETTVTNLARNKTYASSSQWDANQSVEKAFDGSLSTNWQAASGSSYSNQWVEVNFGESKTFNKAVLAEYGGRTTGYKLEYWNGSTWVTAYTGTTIGNHTSPTTVSFATVTGSKARISYTGGTGTPILYEFSIYE